LKATDGLFAAEADHSPAEHLSAGEERFERLRRSIGLFLGPAILAGILAAPLPLNGTQHALAAVLAFVITYWLTEPIPIPVTSVLGLSLCVLLGVAPAATVFGSFSSGTIFLFIGSFIIAQAMMVHRLDRRFAFAVLSLPGVARSTYAIVVAFGAVTAILSAFMSNSATTAMMFPIALGIVGAVGALVGQQSGNAVDPTKLKFGTALMLATAYSASIGGLLTPIGSPPNLIGRGLIEKETGRTITFFEWTAIALPIVLAMFAALCAILLVLNRPEVRRIEGAAAYIRAERAKLGPLTRGERNTLLVFGLAVALWLAPGLVGAISGEGSPLYAGLGARMDEGTAAILAAALLFVLPVNWRQREFTLTWPQAARIDWGTILLFGSGIVLGGLMGSTGLAELMGGAMAASLGVATPLTLTILATLIAVLLSETTSNTASVAIVVPIVMPIASAVGVDPLVPALAAVFGASYGFMLPVSTPPNAIVYGSGMVPITRMIKAGAIFDVIGAVLIVAGVTVMAQIVGLV
jgi:sodium-dependent dicarboxylate transporter 2/3/5